jgi:CheY-like chemotaxis protein
MPLSLQRHVLFVDDDPGFLETVGQLFEGWSRGTWRIYLASTAAKALSLLAEQHMDLVVVDMQMPVVDGSQFLTLLERKYPGLPKVILTGYGNEAARSSSLSHGADLFLEKPRCSEGLESVFAALNELANFQPQEGFRGLLRQVGLGDVLQMECLARNSSILEITTPDMEGRIFIKAGIVIHAEAGSETGEAAFNLLFALRAGSFSLKPYQKPSQVTIDAHWECLVMEAARKRDETLGAEEVKGPTHEHTEFWRERSRQQETSRLDLSDEDSARTDASPAQESIRRQIDEVMVCTTPGEVVYAWQCRDIEARLKLIKFIQQKAGQLSESLALGPLRQLEAEAPQGRLIAQMRPDHKLWIRSSPVAGAETSRPSRTVPAAASLSSRSAP